MSVYNITTTAVQEVALQLLVADLNAERAQQVPPLPPVTVADYLVARIQEMLTSYSDHYASRILTLAAQTYPTLTDEQRGQILTALGRPSFATLPLQDQIDALKALGVTDFKKLDPAAQVVILQTLRLR